MRIVIAMDKFAGTLSAPEAVAAVAEGWHRTSPDDEVIGVAMSDGGPGFLDTIAGTWGEGGERLVTVTGPLGGDVTARFVLVRRPAAEDPAGAAEEPGLTAYVEVAEAAGLHLIPADERDAKAATPS
ncbi:MAG: hypothetical protein HOV83_33885, partial [Catenulispora sp.]|nr:hypothetical protein [Catenulispora sp.]